MSTAWLEILKKEVENKGPAQVARELALSTATISLVVNDRYGASTDNIQAKVQKIYGTSGRVTCPLQGEITPNQCVDNWERAKKIGVRCGNPATIRMHSACLKCDLRN